MLLALFLYTASYQNYIFDDLYLEYVLYIMPTEVMDEEEKVAHFMSVTGVSEEIARRYLDICAGDLNMAISMQLESNEGLNNPSTSDNSGSAASVPQSSNMLSPSSYEKMYEYI